MMSKFGLAIALICFSSITLSSAKTKNVVCYLGSWAAYNEGQGKFAADNIDPTLCTHVIYGFVKLDGNNVVLEDEYLEIDLKNLEKMENLKKINPKLKTLLAVGGWSAGSKPFSKMAANSDNRNTFIQSALKIVKKYKCNGFDIDWEYPAQQGGQDKDKANFVSLLKEIRKVWDDNDLILTAAVGASREDIKKSYDVPALSKYLDIINVMTYDLHGYWDGVTGMNAPLYPSAADKDQDAKELTVDSCIRQWIAAGADPQKIALGLGFYGRSFTLADSKNHNIGSKITGVGKAGPWSGEGGTLGYNEICNYINNEGWTRVWDTNTKCPYAYKGNQWVGFDDTSSIGFKVDYAKSLNLGGVMVGLWIPMISMVHVEKERMSCWKLLKIIFRINLLLKRK